MSIVNLFLSAGRAFADWRRRERAYRELMALDDRSLADIGVRRSQIRALIEGVDVRGCEVDPATAAEAPTFWPVQTRMTGLSSRPR
jgi:uncharacterized protein YjiS (DUF1127 family)